MISAKVFMINKSQNIRIPKDFRLDVDEVLIEKKSGQLILTPKQKKLDLFFQCIEDIPKPNIETFDIPDDQIHHDPLF